MNTPADLPTKSDDELPQEPDSPVGIAQLWKTEDWWAVWLGGIVLAVSLLGVLSSQETTDGKTTFHNPLSALVPKLSSWDTTPIDAFSKVDKETGESHSLLIPLGLLAIAGLALFGFGYLVMNRQVGSFVPAFLVVFLLALTAKIIAGQQVVHDWGLSYPLWALLLTMLISNTVGTPGFLRPAMKTEFYIKTGLVLLGAGILLSRLAEYGARGIFISWFVTPVVLITTYWFGQRILRISSRSLNMTLAADMSVCGVSAAIATAAACKAKREELSLAIGISLSFTAVMMIVMPAVIKSLGMSPELGGAWLGGTIDATGAVAAAGALLSEEALEVATTIKMIQNILIGVIAFCVAIYWVSFVEPSSDRIRPDAWEIWRRFPKFVIGFVAASLIFSYIYYQTADGPAITEASISVTKIIRGWCFTLGFISIGLETDFRILADHLKGGKVIMLYIAGQSFNLCLTLLVAWLMFDVIMPLKQ